MTTQATFHRLAVSGLSSPRWQAYQGRRHLTVDCVALKGNIVVQGMLSEGPEFIPADVLASAPQAWAGRPVTNIHPPQGANDPATFENEVFGTVFNGRYDTRTDSLVVELWLDEAKAREIGGDTEETFDALANGKVVEVSVGAWVWLVDEVGTYGGKRYASRWQQFQSDHIACGLQAQGGVGACSVAGDGCGANRLYAAVEPLTPAASWAALGKEWNMTTNFELRCGCGTACQCGDIDNFRPIDAWGLHPELARELGYIPREEYIVKQRAAALKACAAGDGLPDAWDTWKVNPSLALALGLRPNA